MILSRKTVQQRRDFFATARVMPANGNYVDVASTALHLYAEVERLEAALNCLRWQDAEGYRADCFCFSRPISDDEPDMWHDDACVAARAALADAGVTKEEF